MGEARGPAQVGGHAGNFLDSGGGKLLKAFSAHEAEYLRRAQADILQAFTPKYFGERVVQGKRYMSMQNVIGGLDRPVVMDVKIGRRTFVEAEVDDTLPRLDLLEKMMQVDPSEASDEERRLGVTKRRYMTFREQRSSSAKLGFRLEGIKCGGEPVDGDFKNIQSEEQLLSSLSRFVDGHVELVDEFSKRMKQLESCLECSQLFQRYELVGSSLLFVYDASAPIDAAALWMIDFAHAHPKRSGDGGGGGDENSAAAYIASLRTLCAIWNKLKAA